MHSFFIQAYSSVLSYSSSCHCSVALPSKSFEFSSSGGTSHFPVGIGLDNWEGLGARGGVWNEIEGFNSGIWNWISL